MRAFYLSIRFKLILAFIALVLFVITVFTFFSYFQTRAALQGEIQKHGIDAIKTFTQMAANSIFEADYITILDNARELVVNSDIQSITVLDADGKIWISTQRHRTGQVPMTALYAKTLRNRTLNYRSVQKDGAWVIEFVSPILALGKVAYLVEINISMENILHELAQSNRRILVIALGMLVLAILLGIFLSRLLTTPIEKLVTGTTEIANGNLAYRIESEARDEIGQLARSFNLMTDKLTAELAERQQTEAQLRNHRGHLEELVENRTAEIKHTLEKLQIEIAERKIAEKKKAQLEAQLRRAQKMEAIGTLAGGVAHDLNNILVGLVSYPDLLLIQLPPESALRKPLETIRNSGNKAAAIVQDLLTLARRAVASTTVVNLNDIITEYLQSPEYGKLQQQHNTVQVKVRLAEDLLNVRGSAVHLFKTVMNLTRNAVEAMPEGGTLSIHTENRYVDSRISGFDDVKEGDYAVLKIADTGIGIAPDDIERIFEPFYTKKKMGRSGTGLGMSVVWGAVKDHDGHIDVQSAPARGTEITIYFPVTRQNRAATHPPPTIDDYRGHGESILVVDDVSEQREIAASILSELGYRVSTVASGEAAIEFIRTHPADLMLLDMIMDPGIDGLETYQKILELRPGQKANIVSGFSENRRVKQAQRLGARAYIRKPYMIEKIGTVVRNELGRPPST